MPAIRYEFTSVGADAVKRDFAGIANEAKAFQRVQRESQSASRRVGSRTPEAVAAKQAERSAAQAAKATERAEQQKTRAVERGAKERERIVEREAKAKVKAEERAYKKIERDIERNFASDVRAQRKAADHAKREADKRKKNKLRSAIRDETAVGAFMGSMASAGVSAAVGVVNDVAGASIRRRMENQDLAIALSKSGRLAGQKGVDPNDLLRNAEATAKGVTGTKAGDILEAQQRFVSMTGDLGQARGLGRTFAIAARATGSKETDIASTAATLRDKFGVTSESGMRDALAKLIFQGKSGAFEMSDAAQYMTEMGAAGSRFGLDKGAGGVATLGGLAQIARASTGSGAEASTSVQAMLRQLVAQSTLIKQTTGANVFTDSKKTKTRDVQDVLVDVIKGSKGNLQTLQKIFGEEGIKGLSKMVTTFNEAQNKLGPKSTEKDRLAAGEKALRGMFDDAINAGGNWSEVVKDAATQATSASDQLTSAWETLASDLGEMLAPSIEGVVKNMDAFEAAASPAIGVFADLVDVVGMFASSLQSLGLIDEKQKPGLIPPSASEAQSEQARNTLKLSALSDTEKKYGLTSEQRYEKRKLEDRNVLLSQVMGDYATSPESVAAEKGKGQNAKNLRNLIEGKVGWDAGTQNVNLSEQSGEGASGYMNTGPSFWSTTKKLQKWQLAGAPVTAGIDIARGGLRAASGGEFIQRTPQTELKDPSALIAAAMKGYMEQMAAEQTKAAADLSASAKELSAAAKSGRAVPGAPE